MMNPLNPSPYASVNVIMKSIIAKFKIVISKHHAIYCIVRIYTYTQLIKFTLNFVLCIQ